MTFNPRHRTEKLKTKDTETLEDETQKDENLVLQKNR